MNGARTNRFTNRTILVTGGAAGIGGAASEAFAREGGRVAIIDASVPAGEAMVTKIRAAGGSAEFYPLNLADTLNIEPIIDRVQSDFGPPDVLFNHAGTITVAAFTDTTLDQFDALINVNVRASFLVCQKVVRTMVGNGGGSIVISSSLGASHAFALESVYCMTKAAVLMLAKSIAVEHRHHGIRANAVCPGFVRTGHGLRELDTLRAMGQDWDESTMSASQIRICEPDEVASAVLFLASQEASFINGVGLYIDNGWAVKG